MRAIAWLIAALNSVEPAIFPLLMIDVFNRGEAWTEEAKPKFMERLNGRLKCMSDALGDKEWLEDRFTIADLMMVTVLRHLRTRTGRSKPSPTSPLSLRAAKRGPPSSARSPTSSPSSRRIRRNPAGLSRRTEFLSPKGETA